MRTGKQYLDSLGDGREVWFNGERVRDLTSHPILRRSRSMP
ncbi:MAG TPA: 4-hydroxyphenylacetate 3-hydroxylase N-terminal domain-containing protein [Candidatus Binataceae bacterium]|nr:4-hydroxyphenylacetate 3-hydroxylase N-terminal domain-containing protein [Candidatus Binataceae bacterium]